MDVQHARFEPKAERKNHHRRFDRYHNCGCRQRPRSHRNRSTKKHSGKPAGGSGRCTPAGCRIGAATRTVRASSSQVDRSIDTRCSESAALGEPRSSVLRLGMDVGTSRCMTQTDVRFSHEREFMGRCIISRRSFSGPRPEQSEIILENLETGERILVSLIQASSDRGRIAIEAHSTWNIRRGELPSQPRAPADVVPSDANEV